VSVVRAVGLRFPFPKRPVSVETTLADLTTFGQRDTGGIPGDARHIAPPREHWTPLTQAVPGTLLTGTLPDDHHAHFLLRLPADWNGRLVVAAASGVTDEHTYDLYFSDYALSRGCAFAATDKGVRRAVLDGDTVLLPMTPETSVRAWASRLEALARLSIDACSRLAGRKPARVYAAGLSNGGFVARRAAESASGLFDGAVEISGVLWREDDNLLTQLPAALRATARKPWDRAALRAAGFPAAEGRWDVLVAQYRELYWDSVMQLFLTDLDPEYQGPLEAYDLSVRPAAREAIRSFQNTGDLQVPLISVAGGQDLLISRGRHATAYADLVRARGKSALHRLIEVEDAAHIDTNAQAFPFVVPLMPHAHLAFEALVRQVEGAPAAAATAPSSPRPR
jgi:alpha-beta hydrolase superfamily lysophospholipase